MEPEHKIWIPVQKTNFWAEPVAQAMTFDDPVPATQIKFHWPCKIKSEIEKEPHKRLLKCQFKFQLHG